MGQIYDFIANCGDGVMAVDGRQTIVLWNSKASEILGFSVSEVLGRKCHHVMGGRDADGCVVCRHRCRAITQAKQLEPAPTSNVVVRNKSGEEVWLNQSTVVVPSRDGNLLVLVHLFREVTKEQELLRAARELGELVSGDVPTEGPPTIAAGPEDALQTDLTPREREVLDLLVSGASTVAIAATLCISPRTVGNHVHHILEKLGVHSRLEAVAYSIRGDSL